MTFTLYIKKVDFPEFRPRWQSKRMWNSSPSMNTSKLLYLHAENSHWKLTRNWQNSCTARAETYTRNEGKKSIWVRTRAPGWGLVWDLSRKWAPEPQPGGPSPEVLSGEKTLAGWRAGGSLTPLERAGRREVDQLQGFLQSLCSSQANAPSPLTPHSSAALTSPMTREETQLWGAQVSQCPAEPGGAERLRQQWIRSYPDLWRWLFHHGSFPPQPMHTGSTWALLTLWSQAGELAVTNKRGLRQRLWPSRAMGICTNSASGLGLQLTWAGSQPGPHLR